MGLAIDAVGRATVWTGEDWIIVWTIGSVVIVIDWWTGVGTTTVLTGTKAVDAGEWTTTDWARTGGGGGIWLDKLAGVVVVQVGEVWL